MADDELDRVFSDFQDNVNMGAAELEDWQDSEQFDAYEDVKSDGESIEKPSNDIIRLLETPKDEWRDVDDGFNEVEEAKQANSFISRMKANDSGEPIPESDPPLSKRDASLINWGFDPNPDRADFPGDRKD